MRLGDAAQVARATRQVRNRPEHSRSDVASLGSAAFDGRVLGATRSATVRLLVAQRLDGV